ncbi:MAG TPA: extracellular solute-binding protein [Chloroflexota bacterium]|nr:extracellular solute-binding protein [Chloroflexota bacterium]
MVAASMTRAQALRAGTGLLAAGALAACGPQAGGRASGEGASQTKRPVTLLIDNDWTQGDRLTVVKAWLERANKVHPHIKTELRDNADTQEKTIALFAAEQQGDLMQLDQHMVPVFGPKGALHPIASILASLKFDVNTLYDVPNITHWEGKRHGLIVQLNVNSGVYNKSAFQQAGVKEPTVEWTWDDYLETAKRLLRPQDGQWGTNIVPGYPYVWYWSANVPYIDAKGTKTSWDSGPSREILGWLADLVLRHRVAPAPRESTEQRLNFNNGHYAISVHTVPTPAIAKAVEGKFAWELLPTPKHPKTGKAVVLVTGHNYLVTKKGAERGVATEAVQVLLEFFDKEIQELYLSGLSVGSLPILKSVAARASSMPGMPNMKLALDAIPNGQNFDKVVGFLDFHSAFGPEFTKALDAEVSVEQAAVNMTRVSDAALLQAAR